MAIVIGYGLPATELPGVAALDVAGVPVTPEVARVSPFLNPVYVAVKAGFASP